MPALIALAPLFAPRAWAAGAPLAEPTYDWTLLLVLAFGITGLIWIRRHITRL
ncbi:MAG: hypothetical protein AAGI15_00510 [Pseudomonadota bacterium]